MGIGEENQRKGNEQTEGHKEVEIGEENQSGNDRIELRTIEVEMEDQYGRD